MILLSLLWRKYDVEGNMSVNPLGLAARVREDVPTYARHGVNAILWPPLTMSQGGTSDDADGYGKARDLDVGQWPGKPTRWGTATEVQAANAAGHEAGLLMIPDFVIHQYAGRLPIWEIGSYGVNDANLFPKMPPLFVPQAPVDDVFDTEGNSAFGQMVSYQGSLPAGYMLHGICQSRIWMDVLGLDRGGRLDDTKGEAASVSQRIIERTGGWWFGECFVGGYFGEYGLEAWIVAAGMKRTLDFQVHWWIKAICEGTASCWEITQYSQASKFWQYLVLFVESADTDSNTSENVRFNKIWGYLLILTLPCAAAQIYLGDIEKYNLGHSIYNLCWIGTTFAIGGLHWHHTEDNAVAWGRDGLGGIYGWSGGLLCAFARVKTAFWTPTVFRPHTHLHDYTGHGPDLTTDENGWVHLNLAQGEYVAYAPAGVDRPIPTTSLPHTIEGSLTDFSSVDVIYA